MFNTQKEQDINIVYQNDWCHVEKRTVERINKETYEFSVYMCSDDVFVFAVTEDEQVVLLREYYPAIHKKIPTIVSGSIQNNNPVAVAFDELKEEAGAEAKEMVYLGSGCRGKYTSGMSYFFLAKGVTISGKQQLEEGEDIDVEVISKEEMMTLVDKGELQNVFELACAFKAFQYLGWIS